MMGSVGDQTPTFGSGMAVGLVAMTIAAVVMVVATRR